MKYKVIEDFGSAKKGDILDDEEYRDLGLVSFYIEDGNYTRVMSMDYETADSFVEEGKLEVVKDDCECCDKISKTTELIDTLLDQYKADYANVMEEYKKGKVQPCVKVEAETVYFNLNKVLTKIKEELINE